MAIQRRHFRIPVSRRGLITKNDTTTLCELVDITEEGLHFPHARRTSALWRANDPPAAGASATTRHVYSALDHFQHGGTVAMRSFNSIRPL